MNNDPGLAPPLTGMRHITLFRQDRELRYTWVLNPHPRLAAEQLLAHSDREVFAPDEAAALTALKQQVLDSGQGGQGIVWLTFGGERAAVELRVEPLTGNDGKTAGIQGVAIEVTEQLRMEKKMARLASFPELDPLPVAELAADGSCHYLNPAAQELFSRPDGAVRRREFFAGAAELCHRLRQAGRNTVQREVALGEEWFVQQWHYVPEAECFRVYAIASTARKEATAVLQATRDELESRVARRTEQLTIANREMNRELAARRVVEKQIRYSSAVVKLANRAATRAEYLDTIVRYLRRLSGCESTGVRLVVAGGKMPLVAARGFSPAFLQQERGLALDGHPCACVRVLRGDSAPSRHATVTAGGSVLYDGLHCEVAGEPPAEQLSSLLPCCRHNFGTLAVVPVHYRAAIIGLLLLADRRAYRLRPEMLKLIESLVPLLGEAINRFSLLEQLSTANEILERIFANTHFCIVYLDREFNFIKVNQTYAAIENVAPEYFTGKNHFALYPNAENHAIFQRVIATGEPANYFAKPFVFPRHPEWGTTYWDWSAQPVRNDRGEIDGLIFCLVDVSKRQLAETELQRMREQLNARQRLSDIGTLAAMVAHELRNPLAAIKIAAYNISHKEPGEHLASHLANINSKVMESEAIITNLLFHARLKQPQCVAVNLEALLQECLAAIRVRYAAATVEMHNDLAALPGVTLSADPHQLRELFNNLLTNAYDAMAEQAGCLALEAAVTPETVIIRIRDNGSGIAAGDMPRLFEAFYTTKAKGTGLGLPVCQQIVQNHQGTLHIASQPQQGTTVSVTLPRNAAKK